MIGDWFTRLNCHEIAWRSSISIRNTSPPLFLKNPCPKYPAQTVTGVFARYNHAGRYQCLVYLRSVSLLTGRPMSSVSSVVLLTERTYVLRQYRISVTIIMNGCIKKIHRVYKIIKGWVLQSVVCLKLNVQRLALWTRRSASKTVLLHPVQWPN